MEDIELEGLNEIEIEELKRKEAEEKLNKAYYSCFHSPEGQIVLNHLMNLYYRSTFLTEPIDVNILIAKEGQRTLVINILARMEVIGGVSED